MADAPAKRATALTPVEDDATLAGKYLVLRSDVSRIQRSIARNLGGDKISPNDLDKIQMGAGGSITWTRQTLEGEKDVQAVDGVIILWRDTRQYWPEEYSGGKVPPQCFADDGERGLGDPGDHPQKRKGLPPPYDCAACPNAQFGSDGKRGQACKQTRLVFILTEEGLLPSIIQLPPTSIKPMRQFMQRLSSRGLAYTDCIIRFELERVQNPDGIKYAQVKLSLVEELSEGRIDQIEQYSDAIRPSLERIRADQFVDAESSEVVADPLNA